MGAFVQTLRNLGPARLTVIGGVVVMMIALLIFIVSKLAVPQMTLLYGNLSPEDSAQIVSQLETMGVEYELRQNGNQVYVPGDRVLRLRLNMAEQGLPKGGSIGYEIFDEADSLGTTNFVQNVNLVRALEGELSRTISSLDLVRSARVHVVMPRRELFSRTRQEPSASVIINSSRPGLMTGEQVAAIQHLVAAAVPGLSPQKISIVDDAGNLLARGTEEDDPMVAMAAKSEERRRGFELQMERSIIELLERRVGTGNVQAEVSADIDYDVINTNEETFDPEGQVVRSTQTVEETASSREADTPPVTVATNLPDADTGVGEGASASSAESRTEETVNFEISKRVVNHVRDSGVVKRLSVAVLIDGPYPENPETGEKEFTERPQEEMDQLATLVQSAIGYDSNRGDVVEVMNMEFAAPEEPLEPPYEVFFGLQKSDLFKLAEFLVLGIVIILAILLVVRPLLSRALEALPTAAAAAENQLLAEAPGAPALTGPQGAGEEGYEELIDIDRVEGRVRASSVKKVGEIVEKHPEEALSIIRAWMYQEQ